MTFVDFSWEKKKEGRSLFFCYMRNAQETLLVEKLAAIGDR